MSCRSLSVGRPLVVSAVSACLAARFCTVVVVFSMLIAYAKVFCVELLLNVKNGLAPARFFFVGVFAAPSADPFLRGWEGGISGRGGVFVAVFDGAGASRNYEEKSAVR